MTEDLYIEIKDYTNRFIVKKHGAVNSFSCLDIAHDVIADQGFSKNWRALVLKHYYLRVKELRIKKVGIDEMHFKTSPEEYWPCGGCHESFPKRLFRHSFSLCNKCYRAKNHTRILANERRYYQENREKFRNKNREYRRDNKDKISEYNKMYKERNRDKIAEYNRKYKEKNKSKIAEQRHKYYKEKGK